MASFSILDNHIDWLMDLAGRLRGAFDDAGINYRMVGGLAVYFHVDGVQPIAARSTPGVDFAIRREDLWRVVEAVRPLGLTHGLAKGIDVLEEMVGGRVRKVGRLAFVREKVRASYLEPMPDFSSPTITLDGFVLAPVRELVRMKLTSNRLIDKVHIIDMDGVGLITPEIENSLSEPLRRRLQLVREEERQSTGAE